MLNKQLIGLLPNAFKRTAVSVFWEWLALLCSVSVTVLVCRTLDSALTDIKISPYIIPLTALAAVLRAVFIRISKNNSAKTARAVKKIIRDKIFTKLCNIGVSYQKYISTAEAVQVSVEGIEQLEIYFSQYMPQLFYAAVSTFTIFVLLCFISIKSALILIFCVPVIPLAIIGVQTLAKKLLAKYWDSYTTLGDSFLENIQGLTTLKIYRSDGMKHKEMNKNAELFRKATMRVLIMQLNSISIMDIVAYAGAALGIITAVSDLNSGNISFYQAMLAILLSAEFFIPLRRLGSFFHVAMNGAAAAEKLFRIFDTECPPQKKMQPLNGNDIIISSLSFSYDGDKTTLNKVSLAFENTGLYSIAGKSGCGKSTIAKLLTGQLNGYRGNITIGGTELSDIDERLLLDTVTLVTHSCHIFKGSVRYNLLIGNPSADDNLMIDVLKRVCLWDFFENENGLDTEITEQGSNLSGGQRQRLALAAALLHNTPVYIFDEATSNIDAESEKTINSVIEEMSKEKLVIIISHRLSNAVNSKKIYVMHGGIITESGTHSELMQLNGSYAELFRTQDELEHYCGGGSIDE